MDLERRLRTGFLFFVFVVQGIIEWEGIWGLEPVQTKRQDTMQGGLDIASVSPRIIIAFYPYLVYPMDRARFYKGCLLGTGLDHG